MTDKCGSMRITYEVIVSRKDRTRWETVSSARPKPRPNTQTKCSAVFTINIADVLSLARPRAIVSNKLKNDRRTERGRESERG